MTIMQANGGRHGRRSGRKSAWRISRSIGADAGAVLLLRSQVERKEHICTHVRSPSYLFVSKNYAD